MTSAMRVLLVEDDQGVREGLVELVSEFGEVRAFSNVPEALAALDAETFHLVMTDMRIAGDLVGGRKVAARARERQARVVIMSAATRPEIVATFGEWRPDVILEKPFQLEEMIDLLERERDRERGG